MTSVIGYEAIQLSSFDLYDREQINTVAYLKVLFRNFPGQPGENHEKLQQRYSETRIE